MSLRFIPVVAYNNSSLFFTVEYSIVWMYNYHSIVKGHLGCLKFLAIASKAAINIYIQVSQEQTFS